MKKILVLSLSVVILVVTLISLTSGTMAFYSDSESASGNHLAARIPELWTQTSQADFSSGLPEQVDISSVPGSVKLSSSTTPNLLIWDDNEVNTGSQTYLLLKTLSFNKNGSAYDNLRFDTNLRASKSNNAVAYLRIDINDTPRFAHSTELTTYVNFSDLLDFSGFADDNYTVKMYMRINKNNVEALNSVFEVYTVSSVYAASGSIASRVFNSGSIGAKWNSLFFDATIPPGTSLSFEVRASDDSFNPEDDVLGWTSLSGNSPRLSGLPPGQYKQWRATLTTGDSQVTPILSEVRLYYYP
jgi:predicted ribosomally synthesized peptide with SipW-like signal peptide